MAQRVTKYDPDQPRDDHGMWSPGGGGDGGRVESARRDAHDVARAGGHDEASATAAGEHAAASERADIANEHAAHAAGHLHEIPHAALDAYHQAREQATSRVAESAAALHAAHRDAAQALAELHAREQDDGIEETHGLSDAFGETSTHLAGVGRGGKAEAVRYEHHSTHEAPGEDANTEALTAHQAAFREHAAGTQTALENLHEHQLHTAEALRSAKKEHDRAAAAAHREVDVDHESLVHQAAFSHHERDEDTGDFVDTSVQEHHDRAHRAAETSLGYETSRREHITSGFDNGDAHNALAEETRQTARAIRQLSRITGRAPRVGRKTRKAANRPDEGAGASVAGMAPRYKLKLNKLDFVSPVDAPAQETARVLLLKRSGAFEAVASVAKVSDELGLVFCWAFTSTTPDGADYHDLQGDAIDPDFIKAAADFMASGGATDEMHDGKKTGQVVFAMPMTPEIAKAYGVTTKTTGLMVALKPPPDVYEKFKLGEYTGVSIAGTGTREVVKSADKPCKACGGAYGPEDAEKCASCGAMKSAGVVDESTVMAALASKAGQRLIAEAARKAANRVSKQSVLTSATDGHRHSIDLDDPADEWRDQLSTSYQNSEGADNGHSHAWTYDATTGAITIAEDSGHTHTVDAVVPADVLARAALNEDGERCRSCGAMVDDDCRYCPKCGARMGADASPAEPQSPSVVNINLRAPAGISTPSDTTTTVKSETKEPTAMNPEDRIRTLEAENTQLKKMVSLTDAQRAHVNKLAEQDQINFINLTPSQRDTVLAEIAKADEVVYESPYTKRVYRKSSPLEIVEAAREADAAKAALEQLKIDKRDHEFTKRGEQTLTHFAKGAKGDLRTRLMKALDGEFKDPAEYEEALKALKAANFALESMTKASGVNPHSDDTAPSPMQTFKTAVADFAKRNNMSYEIALERATATDPEIRRLYNEAQGASN